METRRPDGAGADRLVPKGQKIDLLLLNRWFAVGCEHAGAGNGVLESGNTVARGQRTSGVRAVAMPGPGSRDPISALSLRSHHTSDSLELPKGLARGAGILGSRSLVSQEDNTQYGRHDLSTPLPHTEGNNFQHIISTSEANIGVDKQAIDAFRRGGRLRKQTDLSRRYLWLSTIPEKTRQA